MAKKDIDPNLKLITEYLKINPKETFVIPEYQRAYSWNSVQCDKLWQDIIDYMDSEIDDEYFFGTIIVDCSEKDKLCLIDGQQRTTTFLLLLKALLIKIEETLAEFANDSDSKQLEHSLSSKRDKILEILYKADDDKRFEISENWEIVKQNSLLENKSINEQYKTELEVIIQSKDYKTAEENVYKIPRRQKDNKYTNFFKNFKFFYEQLKVFSDSKINKFAKTFIEKCQIIEIRSWQLEQAITMFNSLNSTGMPLSDADIISAQLYSNASGDKKEFNELWESITNLASKLNTRGITNIDGILQQTMYINRAITKEYAKSSYYDVTLPRLRDYYTILNKDLLKEPMILCNKFYKLVQIWDKVKDYPIIKLALKFNENIKIYLISYLSKFELNEINEINIKDITECLIRLFAIMELVDTGYSSNNFKTFLFGMNIKLVDSRITTSEIVNDFNLHINKTWQKEDIKQSLLDYDKNILVFLNEYIFAKEKDKPFDFSENVNIEHIMPQSGHNIDSIRQDADIYSIEEFDSIVNKLGNKILLEEDINKSLGKEWFVTKKQSSIKDKLGYKDSSYNIASMLTSYPNKLWGKADIEIVTNKVVKRIVNFIFN